VDIFFLRLAEVARRGRKIPRSYADLVLQREVALETHMFGASI
jgi:hypothetical protein